MGGKKKILVVEDEKPISKVLTLKLIRSGFDVKQAFDGQQALEMLAIEKFDLILMDLIMPKKNGFDVLTEMRSKGDNSSVVITSNLSQEEDKKTAFDLGAKGYYVKSNTPLAEIVKEVEKILT